MSENKTKLVPVRDFLLVEKEEAVKQTPSGLHLVTNTADEKVICAKVIAVGSGTLVEGGERVAMEVNPGDRVFFVKSLSVEVKVEEKSYLLLREEHVMCRVLQE